MTSPADSNDHDTLPPSIDPAVDGGTIEAPTDFLGILKRLGPGLIIAGSIVGSGELIATTKTGAQAGISLLWLIVIGCLIKVFAQVELGRFAIGHGETTLAALDQVPGPRLRVNWILWFWGIMTICTIGQLGGIVGGVGQSLAITFPIRGDYREAIRTPSEVELKRFVKWEADLGGDRALFEALEPEQQTRILRGQEKLQERIDRLDSKGRELLARVRRGEELVDAETGESLIDPYTWDDRIWASVVAVFTAVLLWHGRYNMIQHISTVLVVSFTFVTIGNVISLQSTEQWKIPMSDFLRGMSFGAPPSEGGKSPWITALATFGIIGVGASELIAYPYWCLEKGYAKFTGKASADEAWARRANGWMKVMRYDAFASMVVYTIATLAFFLMGVAVLYNDGLDPDGMRMVSTLAEAYVPVFGTYAKWLFLSGAVAVLYSTFMVANAGNARMVTDALKVYGLVDKHDERAHDRTLSLFSVLLPMLCLGVYLTGANPVTLVLIAGTMQAFMLPILGGSALYFRYTRTDSRIRPSRLWDVMLAVSFIGLALAGGYGAWKQLEKFFG